MKRIKRQLYALDFTLSCLLRRKGKNLTLLLVYTLMVFAVSSVIFFANAIRQEAELLLQDAPELIVQRTIAGRHALIPLSYLDTIKSIRGIRSVKARLWGYYYHPATQATYTIMVPDRFVHGDDAIEIGQGVLRTWTAAPDGKYYFKTCDGEALALNLINTFSAATDLVTADLILTSENTFRKICGVPPGFANDLVATIRNAKEQQTIAEKIALALPDTRPILKDEILRTYASIFDWRSGYMLVLLSGSLLAFFIFAWDKATGLSAEEKTEIGILKGLGWETGDVLLMKFWEGAAVSLTGYFLGAVLAYIHVFMTSAPLFEHALKGWAVLYPNFRLQPVVNGYLLATLFFLTVLPYTLITLIPAWKVAVTDPDKAMRLG